jgi:inorganic pyrophosphatase/exopolyphosphatase
LLDIIALPLDDIICLSDVDIPLLSANVRMSIILTDHNAPVATLKPYESAVTEIWDHHNDVGSLPTVQGTARNIAYDSATARPLVGSACTLIAESYFECIDASRCEVDRELATLLLGVVALDTFNMDAAMGKGTPRDEAAMTRLESQALRPRDDLFKLLRDAKLDPEFWRGLSASHAFLLDYKEFSSPSTGFTSGVSSVLLSVQEFIQKPGVFEETANMLRRGNVHAVVAMALETQPEAKRSLYVATLSEDLTHRYATFLTGASCAEARITSPALRRVALEDGTTYIFIAAMEQGNTKYSRKQMADYFIKFGETVAL